MHKDINLLQNRDVQKSINKIYFVKDSMNLLQSSDIKIKTK